MSLNNFVPRRGNVPNPEGFFDLIEENLKNGFSINDTARRLKITAHAVQRCIKARPELAQVARANGLKKQGRALPWES